VSGPGRDLARALREVAEDNGFSGVVRVDRDGEEPVVQAHGLADRAHGIPVTADTRVGVASCAKGFTALTVMRLVEDGVLTLDTRARELLRDDLPLIDDAVTVEHLLAHRSGIGDYLDESQEEHDLDAHLVQVPVHRLDSAESYLAVLDGFPQAFEPDTAFAYCNGGFVVLALLAERAAATPFHDLVQRHVIDRAGLSRTAYLRSDALPGAAALGYLHPEGHADELRTNVLHLPVVGGGDGGIFTTAADVLTLWRALDAGRVVAPATWDAMTQLRSTDEDGDGYGLGFWLYGAAPTLVGSDTGASFTSVHLAGRATWSVLGNTTEGAWPVVQRLLELLPVAGNESY
jgi:CubicO group peptidase (beta-lactamase class C family)